MRIIVLLTTRHEASTYLTNAPLLLLWLLLLLLSADLQVEAEVKKPNLELLRHSSKKKRTSVFWALCARFLVRAKSKREVRVCVRACVSLKERERESV